jgi:tetratricopeptide (TPR) repeat protein
MGIFDFMKAKTAEEYFALAREEMQKKLYYYALSSYNKAIEKNLNYGDAYHDRGICKDFLKDYSGAILDFNKAIKLDPNDAMSYYNRARSKYSLQDYSGVIEDNIMALKLLKKNKNLPEYVPNNIKQLIYLNNGLSRNGLMEFELAINEFTEAIKLDSDFADAYQNRAVSKMCLKNFNDALKDAEKALEFGNSAAQQIIDTANTKIKNTLREEESSDKVQENLKNQPKITKKIRDALKVGELLGDIIDEEEGWQAHINKNGTKMRFFEIPTLDITILRVYNEKRELVEEGTRTSSTGKELLGIYPGYKKGWDDNGVLRLEQIAYLDGSSITREWHFNGQLSFEMTAGPKEGDLKTRCWDEDGKPQENLNFR